MTRVAILGCGYVGLELGRRLTDAGHEVVGVRRSPGGIASVREAGLAAVRADVTDPDALTRVPDVDVAVFAASAGARDAEAARQTYVEGLGTVVNAFTERSSPPDRLVYTSSTGVYGDRDGAWVDDDTPLAPETDRERALVEAERIARERAAERGIDGTIARLAGLYGPGRYRIERSLEGPVARRWLNLVHRDDAAGAVAHLIERDLARNAAVTVVDDEPVWKPDFASWLAAECGVDPPAPAGPEGTPDREAPGTGKRCSNETLQGLGYELAYPTYREGYEPAVAAYRGAR